MARPLIGLCAARSRLQSGAVLRANLCQPWVQGCWAVALPKTTTLSAYGSNRTLTLTLTLAFQHAGPAVRRDDGRGEASRRGELDADGGAWLGLGWVQGWAQGL